MRWMGMLIVVGALAGLLAGAGCARPGSVGVSGDGGLGEAGGPFAPASMRIYPLTHLERDPSGEARLILHLEMRDRWGDTVKGIGRLQVQLLRGGELGGAGGDEREWVIDLRDPETNALYFDPATRTYRVQLRDLPAWAEATVDGAGPPVRLLAVFTTPGADGATRYLRDEHTMGG